MKKLVSFLMCAVAVIFLITACGGGGGGTSSPAGPPAGQITCPDGSFANDVSACPAVTLIASDYANVDPHMLKQGVIAQFTGALDPASVTDGALLRNDDAITGTVVPGAVSLSSDNMDLFDKPTQWLAYSQTYNLAIDVNDSIGRTVSVDIPITTMPMSCTNTAIWSTPANYSSQLKDCVSPIGVQAQVTEFNKLQDDTCIVTAGTSLTTECHAYLENGTVGLTNTGIIVGGHTVMWMIYIGTDNLSSVVLLDVNVPTNPVPVATLILPSPLVWIIGNPTGAFVHTADGKGSQLTVDSADKIVQTCMTGCQ